MAGLPSPSEGFSIEEFLSGARNALFLRALEAAGGNQAQAARLLGISPQAVHKFVKGGGGE
jgi:predicted transcriptional regulator